MKGLPGLLLALGLGIVGAVCNWLYLSQGQGLKSVSFVGIARDLSAGHKFEKEDFEAITVPAEAAVWLRKSAYLWEDRVTLAGMAATKSYEVGEILLQQQLRTPPESDVKKLIAADERVLWIPVDTRTFVASLVTAGDQVSFIVPRFPGVAPVDPEPALAPESPGAGEPQGPGGSQMLGPFRVLALGSRLGSAEVLRAAGVTPTQENVMAVAVKVSGGQLDPLGQRLSDLLRLTNFQQVQVLLHPAPQRGAK
ncbi:MAG: hypothetical protein ACT4QC_04490 [Planctomycetaceae bacterium]